MRDVENILTFAVSNLGRSINALNQAATCNQYLRKNINVTYTYVIKNAMNLFTYIY